MRPAWIIAACVGAGLAGPARAETVAVGFAPPVGRNLIYRIEQTRPVDGQDSRFFSERALRFERSDGGYVLHVTLRRLDVQGPPAAAGPFRTALTPLLNVEHRFRVDPSGRITGLDNMAQVWRAVTEGVSAMARDMPAGTTRHRSAQRLLTLFGALDEEGRLAMLAGEVRPLLLFANTPVKDGDGRALETMAGSPLGKPVPVAGQVAVVAREGDRLDVRETLTGEGVGVRIDYRISATTGLVEEQSRRLEMGGSWIEDRRRLTSAP